MNRFGRRKLLKGLGAAGALSALPRSWALAQNPERITVTSYGGVWETAIRDTFAADFTARTGVATDILLGNPNQWLAQVEASPEDPPIDVVVTSVDLAISAGRNGLLERISPEKVPNMVDVPQFFTDICEGWATCFDYGAAGIAYNKERIAEPPKSIVELIERTERGDWVASLPTVSFQPAIQALIWSFNDALGGTLDDISPALDAIKRMKPNTVFWSSVTDFLTQLESGEGDIGIYYDGRVWTAYDAGATWIDFINPAEGAVMTPIAAVKPLNADPIAWEYINSMLSPGPQAAFGEMLNFGMTNSKVQYSELLKARVTPWDQTRFPPVDEMAQYIPMWVERWNKEIGV